MINGKPRTALESVSWRRFLLSSWPWRSVGYLLTTPPVAFAAAVPLVLLGMPWGVWLTRVREGPALPLGSQLSLILLGLALMTALGPLVAIPLGAVERRRLRMVDTRPVRSPHRRPPLGGRRPWVRTRYNEAATWRELTYACVLSVLAVVPGGIALLAVLVVGALVASPFLAGGGRGPVSLGAARPDTFGEALPYGIAGVLLLPALPYLLALLAGAHAVVARALLHGDSDELRAELVQVSRSRARLVDAFEAERRRIERDLHDGAQQRLVSLTLQLGLARLEVPGDSPAAQRLSDAHQQAKQLMAELRELIRGIHPRVLSDRGLPAALPELADQCPVPVRVRTELPVRPPAHLEATAYFVVAEALTNIAKHSGASAVEVTARLRDGLLTVEVRDDGAGGADPRRGTGLTGLADRVAAFDGRMLLFSPVGGPTLLRVELPCSQDVLPSR
ncbi:sensor histidine kinase [Allostreptomyces psammosilenae]|uniref:histidine kinase n=1 Tax=Allostreptomyces psammosilenae TaxID=1892865 RepID=A0A852ZU93_9ACTN|nr:sensor histidine kinase [Allostreptomyces psammosilenae]NYI05137.1 signal transduction histidine kinase [Allostreptomyces psammosilenae]